MVSPGSPRFLHRLVAPHRIAHRTPLASLASPRLPSLLLMQQRGVRRRAEPAGPRGYKKAPADPDRSGRIRYRRVRNYTLPVRVLVLVDIGSEQKTPITAIAHATVHSSNLEPFLSLARYKRRIPRIGGSVLLYPRSRSRRVDSSRTTVGSGRVHSQPTLDATSNAPARDRSHRSGFPAPSRSVCFDSVSVSVSVFSFRSLLLARRPSSFSHGLATRLSPLVPVCIPSTADPTRRSQDVEHRHTRTPDQTIKRR